jgi:hypothetical protein
MASARGLEHLDTLREATGEPLAGVEILRDDHNTADWHRRQRRAWIVTPRPIAYGEESVAGGEECNAWKSPWHGDDTRRIRLDLADRGEKFFNRIH